MDIQAGVNVTIVGMTLVFSALAVLMLAIMALNRIFRPREESESITSASKEASEDMTTVAAVIAVALSLASEDEAESLDPQPVRVLSIHRDMGAWKAQSKLQSTE